MSRLGHLVRLHSKFRGYIQFEKKKYLKPSKFHWLIQTIRTYKYENYNHINIHISKKMHLEEMGWPPSPPPDQQLRRRQRIPWKQDQPPTHFFQKFILHTKRRFFGDDTCLDKLPELPIFRLIDSSCHLKTLMFETQRGNQKNTTFLSDVFLKQESYNSWSFNIIAPWKNDLPKMESTVIFQPSVFQEVWVTQSHLHLPRDNTSLEPVRRKASIPSWTQLASPSKPGNQHKKKNRSPVNGLEEIIYI